MELIHFGDRSKGKRRLILIILQLLRMLSIKKEVSALIITCSVISGETIPQRCDVEIILRN